MDYPKTQEEYIFQYKMAPLFEDKQEALKNLETNLADTTVFNLFKNVAKNDAFYPLRNFAIIRLEKVAAEKMPEIKSLLIYIYNNVKETKTRAKALIVLNKKFGSDADIKNLNEKAINEQSYAICGEALQALAKNSPDLAMAKAKLFENESGKDVLFPVAQIYSTQGSDDQLPFFQNGFKHINGFELLTFMSLYSKTAARCTSKGVLTAAKDLDILSRGASKYTKYAALKGMKDLINAWENKEKTLNGSIAQAKVENKDLSVLEKDLISAKETRDALVKIYDTMK
jgi:hypothetical protein